MTVTAGAPSRVTGARRWRRAAADAVSGASHLAAAPVTGPRHRARPSVQPPRMHFRRRRIHTARQRVAATVQRLRKGARCRTVCVTLLCVVAGGPTTVYGYWAVAEPGARHGDCSMAAAIGTCTAMHLWGREATR